MVIRSDGSGTRAASHRHRPIGLEEEEEEEQRPATEHAKKGSRTPLVSILGLFPAVVLVSNKEDVYQEKKRFCLSASLGLARTVTPWRKLVDTADREKIPHGTNGDRFLSTRKKRFQ